jgi:hypothetical protein
MDLQVPAQPPYSVEEEEEEEGKSNSNDSTT